MIKVAVLGYGVVGSGVVKFIAKNHGHIKQNASQNITIKYVLDKPDVLNRLNQRDNPANDIIYTANFADILEDAEVQIIIEAMGGINPAYDFAKQALQKGKHFCTSNKELVITHGAELAEIARRNNLGFMFEASVGGGAPIIRPMNFTLQLTNVTEISGILNATSNYILSTMTNTNTTYVTALQTAQELGYTEKNPLEDVSGTDAARKLAILLSLTTGKQINFTDIYTEGITHITREDFDFAQEFGFTIKPVTWAYINQTGIHAISAPMLVYRRNPLASTSNVFNCAILKSDSAGTTMFYGEGAGKIPTAAAIISDVIDIAKNINNPINATWSPEKATLAPFSQFACRKIVQVASRSYHTFITALETETETAETLKNTDVSRVFRIYGYDQ